MVYDIFETIIYSPMMVEGDMIDPVQLHIDYSTGVINDNPDWSVNYGDYMFNGVIHSTILNGEVNAATIYLKNNTYEFLYSEFKPIIILSMEKVDLAKKWSPLIKKYNTIPFTKKLNPDLEDYITTKTIDGLFVLIAEQEKEIRTNPEARVSDLLIKIFK